MGRVFFFTQKRLNYSIFYKKNQLFCVILNIVGGSLKTRKVRLKLKPNVVKGLKVIGVLLLVFLVCFIFYRKQINNITDLGYSEIAAKRILFDENKEYILTVKENKTLNAALETEFYKAKYLKNYAKINYVEHKNLIKNINTLLDKGYSNSDVNIILSHGDDKDVTEFSKRERVRYIEEFYEYSYAKLKYYDRYLAYTDATGEDEKTTVIHVNLNMDKNEYDDAITVEEFSYDMLVNKFHALNGEYRPDDLIVVPENYSGGEEYRANRVAITALTQMFEAAKAEGLEMVVNSAYRSYDDQLELIEYYRKWYGDNYVNKYVARAGYSEHQTGLAFDIGSTSSNVFANSKEYQWMLDNCYKYGFILRFTKKAEGITGYRDEPWHFRYVGKEIAEYIHKHKITFEEYYAMFLIK